MHLVLHWEEVQFSQNLVVGLSALQDKKAEKQQLQLLEEMVLSKEQKKLEL